MPLIRQIAELSSTVLRIVIGTIVAVLLAIMVLQIVFRYGLNSSLIWAEEICRYLLIWVSFLAAFAAFERGEIAAMTMLRDFLPRKGGLVVALICNLLSLVLLCVLVYFGMRYAQLVGSQPIPALGFILDDIFGSKMTAPSIYWVYLALPLGLGLLAVRILADMVHYAVMLTTGGYVQELRSGNGDQEREART